MMKKIEDSINLNNIGVIVSARCDSKRLPKKVLLPLNGKPLIIFLLDRLKKSKNIKKLVLATTLKESDNQLVKIVENCGYDVFRGNENNLISRYVEATRKYSLDYVIRVTGDCPLVDYESLDYFIRKAISNFPFELATTKGFFPVGIDFEMYPSEIMEKINKLKNLNAADKEHLTLYFYKNREKFKIVDVYPKNHWITSNKFTVDTIEDYIKIKDIIKRYDNFNCDDIKSLN